MWSSILIGLLRAIRRYSACSVPRVPEDTSIPVQTVGTGARAFSLSSVLCAAVVILVCLTPTTAMAASGSFTWSSAKLVDHEAPLATGAGFADISCPSTSFCVGVSSLGNIYTSSTPSTPASWSLASSQPPTRALACPTSNLCLGIDYAHVYSTQTPTAAGAWQAAQIVAPTDTATLADIACPTASLCVAIAGNDVFSTTTPTGTATAWQRVTTNAVSGLRAISCASATLCAAVDGAGNALVSTTPTGAASTWVKTAASAGTLDDISCSSASLCVAVDAFSRAYVASNPAGGGPWTQQHIDNFDNVLGNTTQLISCTPTGFCLVQDDLGNIVTSSNPAGGAATWTLANVDGTTSLTASGCPSATLCVLSDQDGSLLTSTNPAGGSAAWTTKGTKIDGSNVPTHPTCPGTGLCLFVDRAGIVWSTTNPADAAQPWTSAKIDPGHALVGLTCASPTSCVTVDEDGGVFASSNPSGGIGAWTARAQVATHLIGVDCPTSTFCLAVDPAGKGVTSTNPAGGAATWTAPTQIADGSTGPLLGVTCSSSAFCLAYSGQKVVTSTTPATTSWTASVAVDQALADVVAGNTITKVTCVSPSACLAVGAFENGYHTSTPAQATWPLLTFTDGSVNDIACATAIACFALLPGGQFYTATDAFSATSHWTAATSLERSNWSSVDCPTEQLCVALDQAGKVSVGSLSAAPTDTTPPSIVVSTPAEGQHFAQGAAVTAQFTCDDGAGSGVASCSGPASVDTGSAGAKTFTVTTTDVSGNAASKTVNYVVDAPTVVPPPVVPPVVPPIVPPVVPPTVAPVVSLPSGAISLTASSAGVLIVTKLACTGKSTCAGTAKLTVKSGPKLMLLAKSSYSIAAGTTGKLKLKLSPAGKKLLKKAHGKLKATLTLTPNNSSQKAISKAITVRAHTT